jgi:hypothetical protein
LEHQYKRNNIKYKYYLCRPIVNKKFWNTAHYCNLEAEFNGLVSDRVNSNVGPFAFIAENNKVPLNTAFHPLAFFFSPLPLLL